MPENEQIASAVEAGLEMIAAWLSAGSPVTQSDVDGLAADIGAVLIRRDDLLTACKQLVADWDSVSPHDQVPEQINVDAHWGALRNAIANAER